MNVLIVDDQPEVVESMVTGVNWKEIPVEQVFTAYSVKEAQSVFERERIDVLLCDIEMPPTNGFALLRWAQERFSGVVCIFLSAHAEFEYAQEAVKLGSFDYILQPAPYAEIEAAVERAAGKVREAENQRRYILITAKVVAGTRDGTTLMRSTAARMTVRRRSRTRRSRRRYSAR